MTGIRERILEARDWMAGNSGRPNYFVDPTVQRVAYLAEKGGNWVNISYPHPMATTVTLGASLLDWPLIVLDGPTGTGKTLIAVAGAYINAGKRYNDREAFLNACYQRFSPNGRVEDIFIDRRSDGPSLKPSVYAPFLVADELSLLAPRELEDFLYAVDGGHLARPDITVPLTGKSIIGTMNRGPETHYEQYSPRARSRTSLVITVPALNSEQRSLMRNLDLDPSPLKNLVRIPKEFLLSQEDVTEARKAIASVPIHPYAVDFADYLVDALNACTMAETPGYKESGHFAIGPRCGPCVYNKGKTTVTMTVSGREIEVPLPPYCQLTENTIDNRTARQIVNLSQVFGYLDKQEVGPETMMSILEIMAPTKLVPTRMHLVDQKGFNGNRRVMTNQLGSRLLARYHELRGYDGQGGFDAAKDIFAARERILGGTYQQGESRFEDDIGLIKSWLSRDPYVQMHFGPVAAIADLPERMEAYMAIVSMDPTIGEHRQQLARMKEELVQSDGTEALVSMVDRKLVR